ncbi:hypothetical protein CBF34_10900 [Vagococcus penaei]|uniref:Uncharacterized protein n=1 Tax=Vagococcus penaei TaxID=633807 RepID=A0A1Q2D3H8_9ENTE|nr:DUF3100 domain-containing protein [Vagococcus penaei]AQP52871.1 hypothetical protein BW732_00625 [Vagococcus penaei]RST97637.1 hypothetical protein CBF34_10900 [Vagococcus penaei]
MKKNWLIMVGYVLVIIVIAELIGIRFFQVGKTTIGILPLVFAVVITMILGIPAIRKGLLKKIYTKETIEFAGKNLLFIMLPLMARYGADVAPEIRNILKVGWVFLFQEIGNVGTVLFGLPVAILLGLKREAIGATLGLGREGELAYISEKYTLNSPEGRGVLTLYLIGTIFGSIFFSFFAPILLSFGFDYRALAMSSGVGSASMMTAASSSLVAIMPDKETTILSYAAASQLLTSFLGTYTMVFVAVPLQRKMYALLTKTRQKEVI